MAGTPLRSRARPHTSLPEAARLGDPCHYRTRLAGRLWQRIGCGSPFDRSRIERRQIAFYYQRGLLLDIKHPRWFPKAQKYRRRDAWQRDEGMHHRKLGLGLCAALAWEVGVVAASAQQLNALELQLIRDTAMSICNTVKEAKGQKTDLQLEGEVKAQLRGLLGKVLDVGGASKGSLTREEFEGLSRDATATALEGDRGCRERVFNKMFDKLSDAELNNKVPRSLFSNNLATDKGNRNAV
jgi:hypothetical protein